jgi:NAD+ synthase
MTTADGPLTLEALRLDAERAVGEIAEGISETILRRLRKRGAVVAVSGGIDSSVAAALCVRALGTKRVLALLLPESESSGDTLDLSNLLVEHLGVESVVEDITPLLEAAGCYRRRDEAIAQVVPGYGAGWRAKLVLPSVLGSERLPVFSVVVESPDGERTQARLTADAYRAVVAATSFKQRSRKMLEYFHADRLDRAVVGTPNRLEYDQGFFVKCGDGAADIKPLAHLYKTQVYQLAAHLEIPEEIRCRRAKRSSTSPSPTRSSTCACTPSTTACPRRPSRARRGSGRRTSNGCFRTSRESGERRGTSTSPRCSSSRFGKSAGLKNPVDDPT